MNERRLYPSRVLHGQVAHQIGRELATGVVREGEFLPRESELANRFGVSRQAVREALKVLTAKGMVGSRRRTGTFVLPRASWNLFDPDVLAWHSPDHLSPEFLAAIVELRRLIEPAAAGMAAERGTPERIAAIVGALGGMKTHAGGDQTEFDKADTAFHLAIFAASGNDLIERLGAMMAPLLAVAFEKQTRVRTMDAATTIAFHDAVCNAVVQKNREQASESMRRIVEVASLEIDAIRASST